MTDSQNIEAWMRGALPSVPSLLQPVAHALTACREEVESRMKGVTLEEVWATPGGGASVGFHLHHATGSLDRLFSYARGEQLSTAQLDRLAAESATGPAFGSAAELAAQFSEQVTRALDQLRQTDEATLLDAREVGRARRPSTVIGLLFHGAEHAQRHIGQMTTTLRIVRGLLAAAAS
jgi:hypothetical protein